jgi:hypothetical protein
MISVGRLLLVPAGDQAPAGERVLPADGRLELGAGGWLAASSAEAELIETQACGTYLRLGAPARIDCAGAAAEVAAGVYQVVRRPA